MEKIELTHFQLQRISICISIRLIPVAEIIGTLRYDTMVDGQGWTGLGYLGRGIALTVTDLLRCMFKKSNPSSSSWNLANGKSRDCLTG